MSNVLKWNRVRDMLTDAMFVAALTFAFAPTAPADEFDKKTIATFSGPVEIPGTVLPQGTYVFKLLDSTGSRNIVQVFDKDEKQLYATILAVPDYRMTPPDKPMIVFEERPAGSPEAIRAWFYPGDNYGEHFVYPSKRANELAKQSHHNVLSMNDTMSQKMASKSQSANDSGIKELKNTEVAGVTPNGDRVDMTKVVATKPEKPQ
jgi:hypothetical protein